MTSQPANGPAVRHVAIAGGGIGGLTLASALKRAGIQVSVFERAPELRPVGAGITVQANAMLALRSIGLADAVAAQGASAGESAILDAQGNVLQGMPMAKVAEAVGAPIICIHRGRLQQVLLDGCGTEIVQTGRAVTGYEDKGDSVTVRFEDGSTLEADLLVGADGLHSAVRAQLLGDQPLRYSGYTSWRGVCRDVDPKGVDLTTESWGAGARFGIVPIGHGEIYWFATANAPEGEKDAPGRARESLLKHFGGWHAPIPQLIERTEESAIIRTDIKDRPPVKSWSRGRVALLGDAAHPMTPNMGQGGCQAIEDAIVLARSLSEFSSVGAALQAYERLRVERANGIVEKSYSFGRVGQIENRAAIFFRDVLFKLAPRSMTVNQMKSVMTFDPGAEMR